MICDANGNYSMLILNMWLRFIVSLLNCSLAGGSLQLHVVVWYLTALSLQTAYTETVEPRLVMSISEKILVHFTQIFFISILYYISHVFMFIVQSCILSTFNKLIRTCHAFVSKMSYQTGIH